MPYYRAAWLLPISQPPIRDAWLRTERGRIVAFGHSRPGDLTAPDEIDLGNAAVLPGLVNAHTHLELSWMRGRVPATAAFPDWIRAVIDLRRSAEPAPGELASAIGAAIDEARAFGTAIVGDVTNSLASAAPLVERGMPATVFLELLGFNPGDARRQVADALGLQQKAPRSPVVRHAIAPHAPYSVSPALFRAIREVLARDPFSRCSVHLGESAAETELLKSGTGPWRTLLDDLGVWDPSWVAPKCDPVAYLDQMGFLDSRTLVVHGVQFRARELERLAAKGATLVTCPRGNIRTGAGIPPVAEFFESGVQIAVGTDSLASVPDLNIFAELAELRRLAPDVPARRLLESATINGARALGFEPDYGTIDSGKRDALLAVRLDGPVASIEDHLVSGVQPAAIRWIGEA
jgi:cytosine/adenosine deaminase-related metal-dependent hydrolase